MSESFRLSDATPAGEPRLYRPLRLSDVVTKEAAQEQRPPGFPVESAEERGARAAISQDLIQKEADAARAAGDFEGAAARDKELKRIPAPAGTKQAPAGKIPKWGEISGSAKFKALDGEGREAVRLDYWENYVSTQIATEDLESARTEFDEITNPAKPSLADRAGKAIKGAFSAPSVEFTPPKAPRSTGDPELDRFYNETELADRVFNPLVAGGKQARQSVAAGAAGAAARSLREFDAMRNGEYEGGLPRRVRAMTSQEFEAARKERITALDREVGRFIGYQAAIEKIPTNPALTGAAQAKTVRAALEQFWRDPLGVTMAIGLQSLPASAPGLVAGTAGAAVAGPAAGAVLMGLGSFGAEYLSAITETLAERGVDVKNQESLKAAFQNPQLMAEVRSHAATRGGIIGTFDALTFGVASKMLAPKAIAGKTLTPLTRETVNLPAQMTVQAVGGGAGEATAQLATEGAITKPGQVILEAAGAGFTAPVDVGGLALAGARSARQEQPVRPGGVDLSDPAEISRRIAGEDDDASPAPASEQEVEIGARSSVTAKESPRVEAESNLGEEAHQATAAPRLEPSDAPTVDQKSPATGRLEEALRAYLENHSEAPRGIKEWRTLANLSDLAEETLDPATLTGRSFHRLERRSEDITGTLAALGGRQPSGRLRKIVYWPESKPIPEKYAGWRNDGLWEARWTHGGKWGLWRDFTGEERKVLQGIEAVTARPASEFHPQLEAHRALDGVADKIAAHVLAGRGFTTIGDARAFANERAGGRVDGGDQVARALELGVTRAATSLRARMGARGATQNEMELAALELYQRLPEPLSSAAREAQEAAPERLAAVGIALNPPYTGEGGDVQHPAGARPDAIRQAIRDLFRVPINEGGLKKSRDVRGLYKVKPQTIRVRNQNDIGVIAHETGHHFSETSRKVRELMTAHENEIRRITPYAASQKTAALQREEGFAEYLRLRWTAPAHARASAPQFSAAFEHYVDKNGYRPAFDAIEGAIRDWQNLPPVERIYSKIGEPPRPQFSMRVFMDRIVFEVFDRWLPMRRMVEDLKPDIAPSADPFKLAHLLAGDAAIIEDWLLREAIPFSFARRADPADRGKPLAQILKPVQDQQREFGAYLIAKRANELMRRGKEHLYSADEIAAGLRLETPEFKAAAAELYRYQDQLLDYAVEGGLLSAFVADKFRQFPFYVPFFRVGEPITRQGDIFKQIHGGTENLRDPIANVIENTVRVIHATNRNFVLAKAHDLAREVPGGGRWIEGVPMPERAVKIETEKIIETLREQGVEIDLETAETLATTQVFFLKNPLGDERNRITVVRRSGRAYALQINDEMLWEALERFEPVDIGVVEKILSVPADVLRAGIVLSPEFMARNFARDTLSGFIQSKKGILPVAGTIGGFKEVATRSDAARLYRAFGGAYGDMWRADQGLERKLVERMARRGGFDPRAIVTPRGLLSLLHRIGSVTEAWTRVAEFKATMEPGDIDSLIEAAYNAREVSVDFGMHGHSRSVRFLTRITPFLNPALQGWYKAARTGGSAPFTTLLRGGMLTVASIGLYLLNRGEDWYDELEQWERNTYWHVDIGLRSERGKVIALRIPKPFELGALFGSIPEALAQVAIEQHGKDFLKRLESIVEDVLSVRVVPTALLVPAELWANKSQFTGRAIVPESKERLPAAMQATAGTSLAARKAGELTDTAPAKIDHAVRGLFGTLGLYTMMLADQAIRLVDDEPDTPPLPWQKSPLVRVFFSDPSGANSRHVTELYELLTKAREAEGAMRLVDREDFKRFVEKHDIELRSYPMLSGGSQIIAALRRENERVLRSRDYSTEEKSRMVHENNERIRAIAKTIVERSKQLAGVGAPQ